jgi:hypothetical protein
MRDKSTLWRFSYLGCKLLVCFFLIVLVFGCKQKDGETVSKLREVSAFNLGEQSFIRGQVCICSKEPYSDIQKYPVFRSDKPLYGSIRFAQEPGKENSGIDYYFALDESKGTGNGYDMLYFDINYDLDLTNDTQKTPLKKQPKKAYLDYSTITKQICFNYINVNFDFGSEEQRSLEIMPRLAVYESGYFNLDFVTTKARKGKIKIAGQKFDILLGHNALVSGWFDSPWTALHLISKSRQESWGGYWPEGQRLIGMHKIKSMFYQFSATPAGDKLMAKPYQGPFGTFQIGTGQRDIVYVGCRGSFCSEDKAIAIGDKLKNGLLQTTPSCQLPVGDYLPSYLTIEFDDMTVHISDNYHKDGEPQGNIYGSKKYGIKIRENEPFIFNFSNEPEVMFASPAKDYRIRAGEELMVKAVLTEPEFDMMIRHLDIMVNANSPNGKQRLKLVSLDPKVIITRTNGEIIAEGIMPFG